MNTLYIARGFNLLGVKLWAFRVEFEANAISCKSNTTTGFLQLATCLDMFLFMAIDLMVKGRLFQMVEES